MRKVGCVVEVFKWNPKRGMRGDFWRAIHLRAVLRACYRCFFMLLHNPKASYKKISSAILVSDFHVPLPSIQSSADSPLFRYIRLSGSLRCLSVCSCVLTNWSNEYGGYQTFSSLDHHLASSLTQGGHGVSSHRDSD
ncbi:hypothetical protein NE237_021476 [Protea cynaroides]|uniref:Uncharacterized protein n=1 Tax=Protea cynaroides TaxID=273540 RepID=A0A9Q0H7W8_9MAGN|nr:hypothetical protein NE237_021476 [Protea cynaroides]